MNSLRVILAVFVIIALLNIFAVNAQAKDVCRQPADRGRCRALLRRYYYNIRTNGCQVFNYGGCGGNANNFQIKEDCEAACLR